MFTYLQALAPDERASEIAKIEQLVQSDPAALVPLYKQSALQQVSKDSAQTMITSITVITIGSILAGAYVGFPLALTAGTLMLAQQFLNTQKRKQAARWQIEDQGDFTQFLDRDTQREYRQFAAAVEQESGVKLPHGQTVDVVAHPVTASAFDWSWLNTRYDDYPHLLLLGKTGAGKTYLAERLGRFLDGSALVITPKKKPSDFNGMTVVGIPYDFQAIAAQINAIAQLVKDREAQVNQTGQDAFEPLNVILDEVPAFVAGCKDEGVDVVKPLKFIIRTARTSKIRLILLAQGSEVKTLGIEGEGSLRDNLTFIRLRGFAEPHAKGLGDAINQKITAMERPAMVDDAPVDVDELTNLAANCTLKHWAIAPTLTHPTPAPTVVHQPKPLETFVGEADAEKSAVSAVDRVKRKLAEKLKESGSEWANARELLKSNFRDIDDRKLAHSILAAAIQKDIIEQELRENPNKTKSLFVRVKRKG